MVTAAGENPGSAPTRAASRRIRSTFSSTADSGTRPARTASTRRAPHGPSGPGITRSCRASAAGSVVLAAHQSDTTTPSNPHSPHSGSASSGFSVIVVPLTELYADITSHGRACTAVSSNAARYTSRSAFSATTTSAVNRSVSKSLAT